MKIAGRRTNGTVSMRNDMRVGGRAPARRPPGPAMPNLTPSAELLGLQHLMQGRSSAPASAEVAPVQRKAESHSEPNRTGLPDALKAGVEGLSGMALDDVRVHFNSDKPAQMHAHAYTQGAEIHVAPGQEKHLPHEAWHVVQQKEGRVRATRQMKGVGLNDDAVLEREADVMGARAVRLNGREARDMPGACLDQAGVFGGGRGASGGPIQRAVGFEFEIDSVKTYFKNIFKQEKMLKKKDVLITAPGFKLEADEMPNHSNMEFVTDAFPETPDGGDRLKTALDGITTIITGLSNRANTEIAASALGLGVATGNRFLRPSAGTLIGKPQVTAGIRLDKMSRMLDDMAFQEGHGQGNTNAKTIFGGQMAPNTGQRDASSKGEGMLDVSRAVTAASDALKFVNVMVQQADPSQPILDGPELRALVTQLVLYLAQGAIGLAGYGKLIAGGLMSRTDFATVFKLLPKDKRDYLVDFPDMFVLLVLHGAGAAALEGGYKGTMAEKGPVFEGGLYANKMMFGSNPPGPKTMPQLTRKDWLLNIVGGTDLLTAVSFPGGKQQKAEVESLGSYGCKMDSLGHSGHSVLAPLVELRGLKPIFSHLFPPMALDLFRYVHIVNSGMRKDMPGHLLKLKENERIDLITNTDNSVNVRATVLKEAMDMINRWL